MRIPRTRSLQKGLIHFVEFVVLVVASFASALGAAETVLVQFQSGMKYHVPPNGSLGLTWVEPAFDDLAWTAGTYGVGRDAGGMIQTTVGTLVHTVYTRTKFPIADLAAVESVAIGVDHDDGYVAWVNGQEVARANMPAGAPAFDTDASTHESSNGAVPTYDPIIDITAKAKPALVAGENVLAIGVWNRSADSEDLALVPYLSINRPVLPPGEVRWTAAESPYQFSSTLTVPRGTVLRVDPGVTALFAPGAGLEIQGQIIAAGSPGAVITFDRLGASGSWSGIDIEYAGDGQPRASSIQFAVVQNASTLIDVDGTGDSEIVIEDCVLDRWSSVAPHWDNGANGLRISRCQVGMNTPTSEQGHESVNGYRSSAVLEHCTFGPRTGYNDTIDLGSTEWGGPVPIVRQNEILPGNDDGIDFDNCDGYIIGNFVHGRRPLANGPKETDCPQYPVGGSGMNGGGITGNEGSRPFVMNNIVFDCYHGIGYKNGAEPTLINNTIVGCTWGVILFREEDIADPDFVHGTLVNNLIWDCDVPIKLGWCDQDPKSSATVTHSIVPGGWPGAGNRNPSTSPLATAPDPSSPRREDFRLRPCSKAVDAGFSGPVVQAFHSEDVPAFDSEGNARIDLATVPDWGSGPVPFTDAGAIELLGPDDCVPAPDTFIRGEVSVDGVIDLSDAIAILLILYAGQFTDCEDALDTDDSGALDTTDAIRLLNYLFRGGIPVEPPFPDPGPDPTDDDILGCDRE